MCDNVKYNRYKHTSSHYTQHKYMIKLIRNFTRGPRNRSCAWGSIWLYSSTWKPEYRRINALIYWLYRTNLQIIYNHQKSSQMYASHDLYAKSNPFKEVRSQLSRMQKLDSFNWERQGVNLGFRGLRISALTLMKVLLTFRIAKIALDWACLEETVLEDHEKLLIGNISDINS